MDIPSIKNLKIGMQTLDLHAIAGPKLKLVLNHANAKVKLDVKEIERVLGLSANFPIPDDIAVPISVNAGVPVVARRPEGAGLARARPHRRGAARADRGASEEGPARQVTDSEDGRTMTQTQAAQPARRQVAASAAQPASRSASTRSRRCARRCTSS